MTSTSSAHWHPVATAILRLFAAFLVALPFIWTNRVLAVSTLWGTAALLGVVAAAVPARAWESLPRLGTAAWRNLLFGLLLLVPLLARAALVDRHALIAGAFALTLGLLWALSFAFHHPGAGANLALAGGGVLLALLMANLGAGVLLRGLEQSAAAPLPAATSEPPLATPAAPLPTPAPTATALPSPTADPEATPTAMPTPAPTRPVAGYGFIDWIVDNGEAPWTYRTAYGPRINSRAHAYMYDADGAFVYDSTIDYNGKGYRGPEAAYEKPDDVYRILIIGDSFVEAIQVAFADTFYARLQAQLADRTIDGKRIEIIPMGRTGWGTFNEAAYYQAEGYRYEADLVLLLFFINDVADNFPTFFYPGINNTNYEFLLDDGVVTIVDTNQDPLPPNGARLIYNALPAWLQQRSLARLFVRLGDPPPPVQTPGGPLTRVHPQFYIYVSAPEVEGYPEAWARTADALGILATDVAADGGELVVAPIFIGAEMVANVSGWFPELTAGWEWDPGLPEERLGEILASLPAELLPLRPYFERYASERGGEVYNLLFLPEDGHFNATGHEATAEALLQWLVQSGRLDGG